jgi:glycosyltransferase involved in cell wall biosynthesis
MRILIVCKNRIPVFAYGGTERVVWDLGTELVAMGHKVTFVAKPRSRSDFAQVLAFNKREPFLPQVIEAAKVAKPDVVHFHSNPFATPAESRAFAWPYLVTAHKNLDAHEWFPANTIFLSRDHARRYNGNNFVYNGLNWSQYGRVDFSSSRTHLHFLGNVNWPYKNFRGAVSIACRTGSRLEVMGGNRVQFKRREKGGFRFTWQPNVRFHGQTGGEKKYRLLNGSRGFVFPVTWHEPFGLAIAESLYFGSPVFATPYGAIPELVDETCGVLSTSSEILADATTSWDRFSAEACHARALEHFNSAKMARGYLALYERLLVERELQPESPGGEAASYDLPWN